MRNKLILCLVFVAVAAFVAACGNDEGGSNSSAAGDPQSGGDLTVAVDGDPSSLDPTVDDTYAATLVENGIFDTLVRVDDNGDYVPWLLKSWDRPDDTTWTLELQDGVKFQDGTPFDAKAVKFNLDQERDPKGGSSWSSEFESIKSIDVVDPLTVKIETKEPFPSLLSPLSEKPGMMRSPTAVEQDGKSFASSPVGTGPFEFGEWVKNDHITIEKNDDYWREDEPYLDSVTYRPIVDPTAKINDLLSGRVDTVDYVPPEQIKRVQGNSDLTTEIGPPPYNAVVYMGLRVDASPTDQETVRQAVNYAIDRQGIVDNVVFGAGEPARSMLSSSSWGLTDGVPEIPYDPDKARQLLGGKEYTVEFLEPPSYPQVAQVIQQNLADVGINAKLRKMDWGQLVDTYYKGDYQMMLSDLLGNQRPDPQATLSNWFRGDGSLNGTGFNDPEIDKLLDEAGSTEDKSTREELYTQIQKLAQQKAPYVPIYHPKTVRAWASNIGGMEIKADGLIYPGQVWIGSGS